MRMEFLIAAILIHRRSLASVSVKQFGTLSLEFSDMIVSVAGKEEFGMIYSTVECLSLCSKDILCQSFFYRQNNHICQLVNFVYLSDAQWISSPGTKYLVLYEENCSIHAGFVYNRVTKLCYKIHSEIKVTWPEARRRCIGEEGDLISLDTMQKYYHIVETIRSSPVLSKKANAVFVGGVNDLVGGDWRWLNNVTLARDSPMWGAGKPGSKDISLRYLRISNKVDQGFDDSPILDEYFFICEIYL